MNEPVLLEARDPSTSAGRLLELLLTVADWNLLHPDQGEFLAPLEQALLINPSLPLSLLSVFAELPPSHTWSRLVWLNPSMSLLLLWGPLPRYEEAAQQLLAHLGRMPLASASLGTLVRLWCHRSPVDEEEVAVRHVACRLAELFGLPWSEPGEGAVAAAHPEETPEEFCS